MRRKITNLFLMKLSFTKKQNKTKNSALKKMIFCFRFYIYYTYYCSYSSNFNVSFHIILLLCVFQNYFFYFIPGTGVNGLAGVGCYLHPGNKPIRLQDSCCIRNKCVYAKPHYLNKNLKS